MTLFRHIVFLAALAALAGCGSRSGTVNNDTSAARATLEDLNALLHAVGGPSHAPTKLSDLDRYRGKFSGGYDAVKNGEVVVVWGTPVKDEGDAGQGETVMAYEKAVPTEGGYVLMSAGSIKTMTAAEFATAPKSGKP